MSLKMGGQDQFDIKGPQFDMEPDNIILISHTMATEDADETIYTIPTGKALYITHIALSNNLKSGPGVNLVWQLKIDGKKFYKVSIATGAMDYVSYETPLKLKDSNSFQGQVDLLATQEGVILISGYLK